MTVQNYFVLTADQRATAMTLDTPQFQIDPRAVDGDTPGDGLNLNDQSVGYTVGQAVTLAGRYVAPKSIVDDPDYLANAPDLVAFLLTLPWCALEDETVFAPPSAILP